MGCSKRSSYSDTHLLQEARQTSNKQPNITSKVTRKIRTSKSKVSRRKEIIKIRKKKEKYFKKVEKIKPRAGTLKR